VSQNEVDTFLNDAYEQLEREPIKGPLGEVALVARILLGNLLNKNKD
jgi:hypothetical protein